MGLWTVCLSYCGDQLTDGWVPVWYVATWAPGRKGIKLADQLVAAELWERAELSGEKGWLFHDYHEQNSTREKVLADREAEKVRKAEQRRKAKEQKEAEELSQRDTQRDSGEVFEDPTRPDPTRPESVVLLVLAQLVCRVRLTRARARTTPGAPRTSASVWRVVPTASCGMPTTSEALRPIRRCHRTRRRADPAPRYGASERRARTHREAPPRGRGHDAVRTQPVPAVQLPAGPARRQPVASRVLVGRVPAPRRRDRGVARLRRPARRVRARQGRQAVDHRPLASLPARLHMRRKALHPPLVAEAWHGLRPDGLRPDGLCSLCITTMIRITRAPRTSGRGRPPRTLPTRNGIGEAHDHSKLHPRSGPSQLRTTAQAGPQLNAGGLFACGCKCCNNSRLSGLTFAGSSVTIACVPISHFASRSIDHQILSLRE